MAIATDTLMDEGKCYNCFGELTAAQILEIALLRRRALQVSAAALVSPQQLLDATKCYACVGASFFELYKLGLLNIINGTP